MIRIGLVDDDLEHLRLMREFLVRYEREEGTAFHIEEFHDGLEFVEDYTGNLDVVFLDIEMPQMDGMSAARKIREKDPALTIYDNTFQTGNDALDLVLTEKSLLCSQYHIKFSCMADGAALSALGSPDLYALFGNLLDNAIESVIKEPDEGKRIISLTISRRGQGSHIHIENHCGEEVEFAGGLPLTTKTDRANHGFGVRSIRYIVEKYHGDLLMRTDQGRFVVDIMFFLLTE